MALSDLSFKLYTDSNLTTPFSGLYQLIHYTDLSDNPQDFNLYFGSTDATHQLQATSNPGVDDIVLTPTDSLAVWQTTHAYTLGQSRQPTTSNGYRYKVTTAGTSGGSEPTWPTNPIGATVSDGSVVWTLMAAHHPTTEITLGLTAGDLDTNTPGTGLVIGSTIDGGVINAVHFYIRIVNTVTTVSNNTGYPELAININSVTESEI